MNCSEHRLDVFIALKIDFYSFVHLFVGRWGSRRNSFLPAVGEDAPGKRTIFIYRTIFASRSMNENCDKVVGRRDSLQHCYFRLKVWLWYFIYVAVSTCDHATSDYVISARICCTDCCFRCQKVTSVSIGIFFVELFCFVDVYISHGRLFCVFELRSVRLSVCHRLPRRSGTRSVRLLPRMQPCRERDVWRTIRHFRQVWRQFSLRHCARDRLEHHGGRNRSL